MQCFDVITPDKHTGLVYPRIIIRIIQKNRMDVISFWRGPPGFPHTQVDGGGSGAWFPPPPQSKENMWISKVFPHQQIEDFTLRFTPVVTSPF